jgi:putative ABC transport system permease protein
VAIRQIPGVARVDPDVRLPVRIEMNDKTVNLMAVALPNEARDEAIFQEMKLGGFFTSDAAAEIILNTQVARELGFTRPADLLGKTVPVKVGQRRGLGPGLPGMPEMPDLGMELKVAGLVERERTVFGNIGSQVFVPLQMAQAQQRKILERMPMAGMLRSFNTSTVRLKDSRDLERVEKSITDLGFRTMSIASAITQLRKVFLVVDLLLAFVGSIGMTIACLGITNTMVMAVLERTREIGVMKAVGAEDSDIRRLFLAESAVIGAVGGAMGLVFAWVLGRLINAGANVYFQSQGFQPENLFVIPLWLIAVSMAFSILVSVAAGLYPAARAARIDPTRALRHD